MFRFFAVIIRSLPVLISCALLAAHFLRSGQLGLVMMWTTAPLLLFFKRRWVPYILASLLLIGAAVWADTTHTIWSIRAAAGLPRVRMAVILGGVSLFTALSGLVFRTKTIKELYSQSGAYGLPVMAAFSLTAVSLYLVHIMMRPPGILLDRFIISGGFFEGFWLAAYAGLMTDLILDPKRSAKWRLRLWGIFSAVFFAQLITGLTWSKKFLMTGKLHLPVPALIVGGPIYRGNGYFMLILFFVTVILVGPAWCSWLCYIGSWDNAAARLKKTPERLPRFRGKIRIITLSLVIIAAVILRAEAVPVHYAAYIAGAFGIAGVILMLTCSRKTGAMTHCTSYCPIGFIACAAGRVNPFRISIDEKCSECMECSKECRYDALSEGDVRMKRPGGSCTLCGDCIASCSDGNIHYSLLKLKRETARIIFVVLIVALHALFLGVARI